MKLALPLAGAALLWLLAGCTESTTVELHEPGEYLGKTDPLLQVAGTREQAEKLRERVLMVQTDR